MSSAETQRCTPLIQITARSAGEKKAEIIGFSLHRTREPERLWSFAYNQGAVTRFLLHNGRLLFSSSKGGLVELDAKTGRPISLEGSPLGYSVDGDVYGDRVVFL